MKKKLHCPRCKSEELNFPQGENSMGNIVCSDCEYEFPSIEALTRMIEKNERIFSIFVALFIVFILPGMYMLLGYSCLSYEIDVKGLLKPLMMIGLTKSGLLVGGLAFFVVAGIILWIIFELRRKNNKMRIKRKYIRKHGYEE